MKRLPAADAKYTEINLQRRLNEALGHMEQLQNTLRLHLAPAMKADCQLLLDFYKAGAANIEAELELHKLTGRMDELQQKIERYQKWITGVAGTAGQRQFIRERDSAREQLHRLEERKSLLEARTRKWREVEYPQWDKACQEVRRRIARWRSEHAAQVPAESVIESQGTVLSVAESVGSTKLTAKQQDLSNGFDAAQLPPSPVEAPPVSEPPAASQGDPTVSVACAIARTENGETALANPSESQVPLMPHQNSQEAVLDERARKLGLTAADLRELDDIISGRKQTATISVGQVAYAFCRSKATVYAWLSKSDHALSKAAGGRVSTRSFLAVLKGNHS